MDRLSLLERFSLTAFWHLQAGDLVRKTNEIEDSRATPCSHALEAFGGVISTSLSVTAFVTSAGRSHLLWLKA